MSPRSSVAPVVASGAASVVKLLVATLAFTGAYVGAEVSHSVSVQGRPEVTAQTTRTQTVSLLSKSTTITTVDAPATPVGTVPGCPSPAMPGCAVPR
ncbi:hypothetical protein [Streptosporangium sp. NPDC087985]|uniref:hypothetical protein n=1 Tax=Streptosporangium sp. NPDC087985 TaxID=3366196 RepID=UPI003817EDF2